MFIASPRHDASANHCAQCLPIMMAVLAATYTTYMSPFTTGILGLPCRPCLGPRQLKFGDYY